MTPERLADLRGRVARGELGRGPASAALVAELIADHERLLADLRAIAADEVGRGMVELSDAMYELTAALGDSGTRAKCNSSRLAITSLATALRHLSKAHAFEVAAAKLASTLEGEGQQ